MGVANRRLEALLVEPDDLMARMVARLLRPTHAVCVAQSVDEALQRLVEPEAFDVVLCPLALPMRSGVELYEEVRRRNASAARRFVFLTEGIFSQPHEDFLQTIDNPRVEKGALYEELPRALRELAARAP